MLWPARQVPEKRGGHPQATPGHRVTAKHRVHRPAEGEGPSGIPTPSTVLPRAAQTAGPRTGDRPPPGPRTPPAAPGPQLCPLSGWGLSSRHPPSTRAGVSLHLRHFCTQGALPTCIPQARLPEAPAGPSEHSLPAPGPSIHPCLPGHLGEPGAQSPVPLPQHGAQPEGRGMPSPCPF